MPDLRISEDTILLTARLVNEAENMKESANQALKDAWADHREALKALGLTGKEISAEVAQFKAAITESRLSSVEVDKRDQKAEGKEEYLAILTSPRARARETKKVANGNASNSAAFDVEQVEELTTPVSPIDQIRNDPSLHIVSASEIKPKSEPQPTKAAGQAGASGAGKEAAPNHEAGPSSVENEAADISTPITEPQPLTQAGSDLTTPQALDGQVATHSPETATESDQTSKSTAVHTDAGNTGVTGGESAAPKYAAPGVVTWETYPPEGVTRSAVSIAFANIGQDAVLIKDELANGKAQPIVKIGREILDGWARFMTARDMTEMDGKPLAYAVVQYAGTDPLIDAIKLNVEGRVLDEGQKRKIAATLVRQNPSRKDDIYKAFELWMEPV